jgi:hypothetical protein
MLIKVTNGNIDQYPFTVGMLRREYPLVSFPKAPSSEMLASYGVYPVTVQDIPTYNVATSKFTQDDIPILVNGVWTISCSIVPLSDTEIADYNEQLSEQTRNMRDMKLGQSDWTQVSDAPVDQAAWAAYRQALRDITAQAGFPTDITWPTKPE